MALPLLDELLGAGDLKHGANPAREASQAFDDFGRLIVARLLLRFPGLLRAYAASPEEVRKVGLCSRRLEIFAILVFEPYLGGLSFGQRFVCRCAHNLAFSSSRNAQAFTMSARISLRVSSPQVSRVYRRRAPTTTRISLRVATSLV